MNLLDKLFSREIERRTGEHAVKIYIDSQSRRKRTRSIGSKAFKSAKTTKATKSSRTPQVATTTKASQGNFLHRLDVRFPWLKLIAVCIIGVVILLDLCDVTISRTTDSFNRIRIAPMSKHVRVTERILEGKKLVALTFDDGPSSDTTPKLLDVLHQKDVPATFFMLGYMINRDPELAKKVEKLGHEAASHTMYHQNLVRIPESAVQSDISEFNTAFQAALGHLPKFTRPPYGNTNGIVSAKIGNPLILWSVDTLDWKIKTTDSIISTTMDEVYDGAIILMHDIYPTSVDAVPVLIDTLRQNGYEFVTISELAEIRKTKLKASEIYYNFTP